MGFRSKQIKRLSVVLFVGLLLVGLYSFFSKDNSQSSIFTQESLDLDPQIASEVDRSPAQVNSKKTPKAAVLPLTSKTEQVPEILANEPRLKRWEKFTSLSEIPFDESDPKKYFQRRQTLELTFFNEKFKFNRDQEEISKTGSLVWTGRHLGNQQSLATIAIKDGVIVADFNLVKRYFSIRYDPVYNNILIEFDLSKPPTTGDCTEKTKGPLPIPAPKPQEAFNSDPFWNRMQKTLLPDAQAADAAIINILVLGRTGVPSITLNAENAVNYTNQAFTRSGVNIQLNLLYSGPIAQASTDEWAGPKTAAYDDLLTQYGPDMVMFLNSACTSGTSGTCGKAAYFLPTSNSLGSGWAAILKAEYLAHEVGHMIGADHNAAVAGTSSPSYARGWTDGIPYSAGFDKNGTIMSYTYARYPYFSSPAQYGSASQNNARIMNENSSIVAGRMPLQALAPLADQTVNEYSSVSFSAPDTGYIYVFYDDDSYALSNSAISYQWYKDSNAISGATSRTLSLANVRAANNGIYKVVITQKFSPPMSAQATLTVRPAPVITLNPVSQSVAVGATVTFSGAATGAPLTYQWYKNSVTISGATLATYAITNVQTTHAGAYNFRVTNSGGSVSSNSANLTVGSAPVITTQPLALTKVVGSAASFSVVATGTALTYQWMKDGVAINGATQANYSIASVATTHNGQYSVKVSNTLGQVTSNAVQLSVGSVPVITTQPLPLTKAVGIAASFSVVASGTDLTFQWMKDGAAINGATQANYSIASVATTHNGQYSVRVSNTFGQATSNAVKLAVGSLPVITTQPLPLTKAVGSAASFSVVASGTDLTYQWLKDGVAVNGATQPTYNIASVAATHTGQYSVRVSNTFGQIFSNAVALTVGNLPSISTQPLPLIRALGGAASFSVVATGPSLTYQWLKDTTTIAGATQPTYNIANIVTTDAGLYSVKISNSYGVATSNAVKLTVGSSPAITTQPLPLGKVLGNTASFLVIATGDSPLTFQWSKDGSPIAGATKPAYDIASVAATDVGEYTVKIKNPYGDVTSNAVALTIGSLPVLTTQPLSLTKVVGGAASFSVVATGGPLTYQWLKNGINIVGATQPTYSIASAATTDAGQYTAKVSNSYGNVTSRGAQLSVGNLPVITTQPLPLTQALGSAASFSIVATGTGLTYQWLKDGNTISGAIQATYNIASLAATHAGLYSVRVSNTYGDVTSNTVALTVGNSPVITTQPLPLTKTVGSPASFSVAATGTGLTYQWLKDGNNMSGATQATYNIASVTTTHAGQYSVKVSNTYGSATSNSVTLAVGVAPTITTHPKDQEILLGNDLTLTVTSSGTPPFTYQWFKNSVKLPGATQAVETILNATESMSGSYSVVVSNSYGTATSQTALVKWRTFPAPVSGSSLPLPITDADITSSGGFNENP